MRRARQAKIVLSTCFVAGGTGIGTWGANLPALGRRADLTEGEIGLVLLCFAFGAILAMVNAPRIIARLGAERTAICAALLFGIGIASVGTITAFAPACVIAALCGLSFGTLDVSMNDRASHLERLAERPMMSFFHATFSAGTLAAAAGYAYFLRGGLGVHVILLVAGAAIVSLSLAALLASASGTVGEERRRIDPTATDAGTGRRAVALGAIAFMIFFAEGAIMDWAALYMVRVIGAAESASAFGYAIFAGMMLAGRLLGDHATRLIGPLGLFRAGMIVVVAALALLQISNTVPMAYLSFGLAGFGMANVIPVIFSAAGRLGALDGGRSLSRVLTMGYTGILIGPAIMGFIAEAISLKASFAIVAVLTSVTVLYARVLR